MKKYFHVLKNCQLFAGIAETGLEALMDCLSARHRRFRKNSFIYMAGDSTDNIGIVLAGAVHVIRDDFWGRRKIVARIESGGLFGEAFACAGAEKLPVGILAAEASEVLLVNCKRITGICSNACVFHAGLIKNVTLLLANKNIELIQKLEHITQATTREKLLSYLSEKARIAGKNAFTIPFNREELAAYLSVERSAMSAELSRMRNEGMVLYRKNHFDLLKKR